MVQIAPGDDGGSQVHAEWTYTEVRLTKRPPIFLIDQRDAPIDRAHVGRRSRPICE
jgi:hypothetical protein